MPEPLSEAVAKVVEELLREGLSATEVADRLKGRWPIVTAARVRMEAYRLGISLRPGPRIGAPGAGRPQLSPNRARAFELREQGMSTRDIALELGLTRQGVERILRTSPPQQKT